MTTTLRPTGPIQQGADGAKSRAYDVCDNGRPVGAVEIGTDPRFGASVGVLRSLSVDESRRRRGRGTIAALAAEEVLRGWGCTQVRLAAPEGNEGAQGLAAALGYTERGRNMLKELDRTAPALPDGVVARQMSAEEFARWQRTSVDTYAQSWVNQGIPAEQAMEKSRTDHARNLPDGIDTVGMHFRVLVHEDAVVGHVWVSVSEESPGEKAGYVFDVEVDEEYRGRSYGRALMWQAEHITLDAGAHRLGLHVFAGNTPAQRLYESLGYRTTQYNLAKTL
ncbi:GNAT family N-acetyltransferase [Streptomyces sp. NPDC058092]|uniref:GNAT family N-acetyltransferase n=1 Tax=Streptomyces sp. NPDC058092 TaxID=3346336 RepID=UPI0036E6B35E